MKNYLMLILLLVSYNLKAQLYCGGIIQEESPISIMSTCSKSSTEYQYYHDYVSHIPDLNTPIKTININFHIFQDDNGDNNFQNVQADLDYLNDMFAMTHWLYYDMRPASDSVIGYPTTLPNRDSRIRFNLTGIYFYQSTTLNNSAIGISNMRSHVEGVDPDRLNSMNIYFTQGVYGSASGLANGTSEIDFNYHSAVVLLHVYTIYLSSPVVWNTGMLLAHEIAHNLDLCHTYAGGGCPTTCNQLHTTLNWFPDIFGTPYPGNCFHTSNWSADAHAQNGDGITNNLMGGNKEQLYLSPMQVGKMQRSLALTSVRRYVTCDSYDPNYPIFISGNEVWDFNMRVYTDVIVPPGTSLTITCELHMPKDGKIIVHPGGRLIIDGGKITNSCGGLWTGITVLGNRYLPQGSFLNTQQGYIELKNNAIIEHASTAIRLGNNWNEMGAVLNAKNSTLKNNRYGIWFGSYQDPIDPLKSNISIIEECSFVLDNIIPGSTNLGTKHFIALWNVVNLRIRGNVFINEVPAGILLNEDRGTGILSLDASILVTRSYNPSSFPVNCIGSLPMGPHNEFINLTEGIYYSMLVGDRTNRILDNKFLNTGSGIHGNLDYGSIVYKNDLRWNANFVNASSSQVVGIQAEGSGNYQFRENNIEFGNVFTQNTYGIISHDLWIHPGLVHSNHINNITGHVFPGMPYLVGQLASGNNQNLEIHCNRYGILKYDWLIFDNLGQQTQAENQFSHCNPFSPFYNIWAAQTFDYSSSPPLEPNCTFNVNFSSSPPANCTLANPCVMYYGEGGTGGPGETGAPERELLNLIYQGDNEEANQLFSMMLESEVDQELLYLLSTILNMYQSNRTFLTMEEYEKAALYQVAKNDNRAGTYSKAILRFFDNAYFEQRQHPTPYYAQSKTFDMTDNELVDTQKIDLITLTVKPNPASDVFSINYNINRTFDNASLTLFDMSGKRLHVEKIDSPNGEITFQSTQFSASSLLCFLQVDGEVFYKKIVILK